jgi:hypothetical protein
VILKSCRIRRCGERMTTGQPGGRALRMRMNPLRPEESMKLTPARSMIRRCGFFSARCPRCSDKVGDRFDVDLAADGRDGHVGVPAFVDGQGRTLR